MLKNYWDTLREGIRGMINLFKYKNATIKGFGLLLGCLFVSFSINAQVKSSIDSTTIKIGEQITYKIEVEADSSSLVIFPEGQSFMPLELIDSYPIDTVKKRDKFNLIKRYGLTQFDSGSYTIPPQKILIGDKVFSTDSMRVEVNTIKVDTTEQGLYDIKPLLTVEKPQSNFWKYLLLVLLIVAIIGFLLYWFIWRKKPLTEEEKIALLPPYDRAKLALKQLDERKYLENSELKEYYSELTFAIRRYLDEKVYEYSLESTTDELILRLNLLREANQIGLSGETIKNLESILKRADLVKFAKSNPDIELARMDRSTIDHEIDHVKEALPEPTEEELLLNEQYKKRRERQKRQWKIVVTAAIVVILLNVTFVVFGIKYGFGYVKDTILGNDSLELLEGEWVSSAYGVPPIYISTPEVLERSEIESKDQKDIKSKSVFSYGALQQPINIVLSTTRVQQPPPSSDGKNSQMDIRQYAEAKLVYLENNGVTDIITRTEKFTTPNAQEGIKVYGQAKIPVYGSDYKVDGNYVILAFSAENVVQEVLLTWHASDKYANDIMDRILNSVELKKPEEDVRGN